ncbi:uncharacterized protein LOC103721190 isoform X2 [Phoenix dactylifera]|uniref:Uncharacterized protein LOC103721190 isoform X2 n=1 Tax=Phoenix dactylifera TaxID=42345 RepID=A0A8B7CYV6_PHODC|nr:uncharacterized protein LOC103721190 isoform X2 [Phoenix dactylifera]
MSLLPPPFAVKFLRSLPSAASASSTTGAASASASYFSIPLNNVSSHSIQRRFAVEAAGKSPIEPHLPFSSLALDASASPDSASLTASVASPPSISLTRWNLDHRHIFVLNCAACVAALSALWLFFSAIPALLAFKRAAESLEKLLDVTAEELPDTMAAVRLSGMEISDLTMELSDLGQEITQGVRSSTRAVRIAEDRLRRLTTMAPIGKNHMEG